MPGDDPLQAVFSDSMNRVDATIAKEAVIRYTKKERKRLIEGTVGGVIQLLKFEIVATHIGSRQKRITLFVTDFKILGSNGSGQFGMPQAIQDHTGTKQLIQNLLDFRRQESATKESPALSQLGSISSQGSPTHGSQMFATQAPVAKMVATENDGYVGQGPSHLPPPLSRSRAQYAPGSKVSSVAVQDLLSMLEPKESGSAKLAASKDLTAAAQDSPSEVPGRAGLSLDNNGDMNPPKIVASKFRQNDQRQDSPISIATTSEKVTGRSERLKSKEKRKVLRSQNRISSRDVNISRDQEALLNRDDSWLPAEPGRREPAANVPIKILDSLNRQADLVAQKVSTSTMNTRRDSLSAQSQSSVNDPGTNRAESEVESDAPVSLSEWPPSPDRGQLPPDSSLEIEEVQSRSEMTTRRSSVASISSQPFQPRQSSPLKTVRSQDSRGREFAGKPPSIVSSSAGEDSRRFWCRVAGCDKTYKTAGGLKFHKGRHHSKEETPESRKRDLSDCDKSYQSVGGPKYHVQHHHDGRVSAEKTPTGTLESDFSPALTPELVKINIEDSKRSTKGSVSSPPNGLDELNRGTGRYQSKVFKSSGEPSSMKNIDREGQSPGTATTHESLPLISLQPSQIGSANTSFNGKPQDKDVPPTSTDSPSSDIEMTLPVPLHDISSLAKEFEPHPSFPSTAAQATEPFTQVKRTPYINGHAQHFRQSDSRLQKSPSKSPHISTNSVLEDVDHVSQSAPPDIDVLSSEPVENQIIDTFGNKDDAGKATSAADKQNHIFDTLSDDGHEDLESRPRRSAEADSSEVNVMDAKKMVMSSGDRGSSLNVQLAGQDKSKRKAPNNSLLSPNVTKRRKKFKPPMAFGFSNGIENRPDPVEGARRYRQEFLASRTSSEASTPIASPKVASAALVFPSSTKQPILETKDQRNILGLPHTASDAMSNKTDHSLASPQFQDSKREMHQPVDIALDSAQSAPDGSLHQIEPVRIKQIELQIDPFTEPLSSAMHHDTEMDFDLPTSPAGITLAAPALLEDSGIVKQIDLFSGSALDYTQAGAQDDGSVRNGIATCDNGSQASQSPKILEHGAKDQGIPITATTTKLGRAQQFTNVSDRAGAVSDGTSETSLHKTGQSCLGVQPHGHELDEQPVDSEQEKQTDIHETTSSPSALERFSAPISQNTPYLDVQGKPFKGSLSSNNAMAGARVKIIDSNPTMTVTSHVAPSVLDMNHVEAVKPVACSEDATTSPDSVTSDQAIEKRSTQSHKSLSPDPAVSYVRKETASSNLTNTASPHIVANPSPGLKPSSTAPHLVGGKGDTSLNRQNIFDRFKSTYPGYPGDTKHLIAICKKISNLAKTKRMEHPSLWDDFIIRHKTDYPQYLRLCLEDAEDAMQYEDFYRSEIEQSLHQSRIITPKNLDEVLSLADQGNDITAKQSKPQSRSESMATPNKCKSPPKVASMGSSVNNSPGTRVTIDLTGDEEGGVAGPRNVYSGSVEAKPATSSACIPTKSHSQRSRRSLPWTKPKDDVLTTNLSAQGSQQSPAKLAANVHNGSKVFPDGASTSAMSRLKGPRDSLSISHSQEAGAAEFPDVIGNGSDQDISSNKQRKQAHRQAYNARIRAIWGVDADEVLDQESNNDLGNRQLKILTDIAMRLDLYEARRLISERISTRTGRNPSGAMQRLTNADLEAVKELANTRPAPKVHRLAQKTDIHDKGVMADLLTDEDKIKAAWGVSASNVLEHKYYDSRTITPKFLQLLAEISDLAFDILEARDLIKEEVRRTSWQRHGNTVRIAHLEAVRDHLQTQKYNKSGLQQNSNLSIKSSNMRSIDSGPTSQPVSAKRRREESQPGDWWRDNNTPYRSFHRSYSSIRHGSGNSYARSRLTEQNDSGLRRRDDENNKPIDPLSWTL